MNERTKQALKVMEAAALLGVLGDGLLRATPWGLNVLLWTGALIITSVVLLAQRRQRALSGGGHLLLLSATLFAATFAWRDSLMLNFLAASGLGVALGLMAWRARAGRIWMASLTEYAQGLLVAGVNAFLAGFPALIGDIRWRETAPAGWARHLKSVALGGLMALPLLILFGGLLMAADAAFERMAVDLFFLNHQTAFGHFFLVLFLAWITGGYLRGLLLGREVQIVKGRAVLAPKAQPASAQAEIISVNNVSQGVKTEAVRLGIVEVGVTLGLLNLLFFAFVLLQLRYFFGDATLVQDSEGLTFAEYYRRGFFELVTVAALVLPLLLGLHWLLRKGNAAHERVFNLLAGMQVFLLFVIMASAVRRLLLYQSVYGLTEQRLYTTAFMAWLALVFIWFAATALRGRREQFACGALVAALLVIATLHLINPDSLIVRVNLAHAQQGRIFDAHYASSLSADAAPALMASLPALSENDRRVIAGNFLTDLSSDGSADWRSWNWARAERRRIVLEQEDALRVMATTPFVNQPVETPELKQRSLEAFLRLKLPLTHSQSPAQKRKAAQAPRALKQAPRKTVRHQRKTIRHKRRSEP